MSNLSLGTYERANAHPYGQRISIDGGQVNVSVSGEGEKTVVLLSGYGTASPVLDFAPLINELDDAYTVVVIERFGYGYSDLDVTQRTVANISTELHETLSTLGVKDSYVLMAHSLAGIYSLDYVNRFPGEVSALVTIDGTVPEDFAAVAELSYPTGLPVPAFVSQQLIDANTQWLPAHQQQLEPLNRSELVVLDGGHYLHWTHSWEMAEKLRRFLG